MTLDTLRVEPYATDRVPNADLTGELTWQAYHGVRNALVTACRRHGPTGPMGVVRLDPDVTNPYRAVMDELGSWDRGDPDPVYWLVPDQYNHERYCYAELLGDDPLTAGWLLDVTATLREFPGWGLGVGNIPGSYLLIFADRLLVNGRLARCRTAFEVVATASRLLRRGRRRWWQVWR